MCGCRRKTCWATPRDGFFYLMNMLAQERLTNACGAVAGAEAALQATIDCVKERQAFGRPVAHFQNTRFKLAEMRTQIDAGAGLHRPLRDGPQPEEAVPEVAAEAKLFTTELLGKVVDEGVQLYGGWGYRGEYPICRMYANARIQRIFAGTSEIMKEIISRGMSSDATAMSRRALVDRLSAGDPDQCPRPRGGEHERPVVTVESAGFLDPVDRGRSPRCCWPTWGRTCCAWSRPGAWTWSGAAAAASIAPRPAMPT